MALMEKVAARQRIRPLVRELPADVETPISIYLKLRGLGPSFLLESVEGGEHLARYSMIGAQPWGIVRAWRDRVVLEEAGRWEERALEDEDVLDVLRAHLPLYEGPMPEGLPRFTGGAIGYMGYDLVRSFERLPARAPDTLGLPEAVFLLCDRLVIYDHVKHRLLVVAHVREGGEGSPREAEAAIEEMVARLRRPLPMPVETPRNAETTRRDNVEAARRDDVEATRRDNAETTRWDNAETTRWDNVETTRRDNVETTRRDNVETTRRVVSTTAFSREDYEAAVLKAKEYIARGDIFQVVLSRRIHRRTSAQPFDIYRALRRINPSPYMFYLELPEGLRLIGSSPEVLVRVDRGLVETRPLAGTRRRGASPAEDKALAEELLADPKERAEHVMLVDLARNDLGRVCRFGSVSTPVLMEVERYSHVMHIVSQVQGELSPSRDAFDVLRACFPAGTVSGAPKVRAMEIIEELEPERRGPYAGAVGYFGFSGNMDTCITIRTLVMRGDRVYLQAGAGIVADSDPGREYEESENKLRALAQALTLAEGGEL